MNEHLKKGDVVTHVPTSKRYLVRHPPSDHRGELWVEVSEPGTAYSSRQFKAEELHLEQPPANHRSGYSLDEEIAPHCFGWMDWGWKEEIALETAVDTIAACGGLPAFNGPGQFNKKWARYFLSTEQSGGYNGEAYALVYGGYGSKPTAWRVGICRHEKVEGTGANHNRGWHPGYCKHCGLNMSVDSGD